MGIPENHLKTDVLVIGGGIAGCSAAMRAKELGAHVILVEQLKSGYSGMSAVGTHVNRAVLPGDDFDRAFECAVLESEYMVDQEYAEGAIAETWERLQELMELGSDFRKDDSGQLRWYLQDTRYPNHKRKAVLWEPMGSHLHILKIKTQTLRRGVNIFDRVQITELLTNNGRVTGAIGFHTREGDFYIFEAKSVIIASGSFEGGGVLRSPKATGDGVAIGLRVGAQLRNMEFGRTWLIAAPPPGGGPTWIHKFVNPQDEEVQITNAKGEEFLEQYELGRRIPGRRYDGPPWDLIQPAIYKEIKEGRGPCFIDYGAVNKTDRLRVLQGSYFDNNLKQFKISGNAFDKLKRELVGAGGSQGGGIRINPYGETTVSGLYAAGVASDMCCAQHHSIPANLMGSQITGRRSGESAAKYALDQKQPVIDKEQLKILKEKTYLPLNRPKGMAVEDLRMKLVKPWLNIEIRNKARLINAQEEISELIKEYSEMSAGDYRELAECHKLMNYLLCSQVVAKAASARCETRLDHVREDYPLTDNMDWLKWVIVYLEADQLQTCLETIPIERWKYRPEPIKFDRLMLKEGNQ